MSNTKDKIEYWWRDCFGDWVYVSGGHPYLDHGDGVIKIVNGIVTQRDTAEGGKVKEAMENGDIHHI